MSEDVEGNSEQLHFGDINQSSSSPVPLTHTHIVCYQSLLSLIFK